MYIPLCVVIDSFLELDPLPAVLAGFHNICRKHVSSHGRDSFYNLFCLAARDGGECLWRSSMSAVLSHSQVLRSRVAT